MTWGVFDSPRNHDEFLVVRASPTLPRSFPIFVSEHETFQEAGEELERLGLLGVGFVRTLDEETTA